jgi:DNA mismatch repair ATPase MutS
VVENIQTHRKMLVIFDELFRGTNVKDAYEGSLAVISAFSNVNSCYFAISTHIVEVAKELAGRENIRFYFFDAEEKDGMPAYTYRIKEGITNTRLGMQIIRKEKIIESIAQLG